ncbi:MAG: beta-ketoacyl synthase chain length factor [Betaproteobacteria bacterium]
MQAPTILAASDVLPPAERRRVGIPVKLALAAGCEALLNAARDAASTASVFTSSQGDGENLHRICVALASPEREVSPTRFHNCVHNAPAGYWSIAMRCRETSTSLCGHDASFAAGLLDASVQVAVDGKAVVLIAYDQAYPEPLHAVRPISASFGMALVMVPQATSEAFAVLDIRFASRGEDETRMSDSGLETLRGGVPAARCLPLLGALARNATETIVVDCAAGNQLRVAVAPCS